MKKKTICCYYEPHGVPLAIVVKGKHVTGWNFFHVNSVVNSICSNSYIDLLILGPFPGQKWKSNYLNPYVNEHFNNLLQFKPNEWNFVNLIRLIIKVFCPLECQLVSLTKTLSPTKIKVHLLVSVWELSLWRVSQIPLKCQLVSFRTSFRSKIRVYIH